MELQKNPSYLMNGIFFPQGLCKWFLILMDYMLIFYSANYLKINMECRPVGILQTDGTMVTIMLCSISVTSLEEFRNGIQDQLFIICIFFKNFWVIVQ